MKLNTQAFPYPVLTNDEGAAADYDDSAFQCNLEFDAQVQEDGNYSANYDFLLSNDEIESLIESGHANYAIDLSCSDTLKRQIIVLNSSGSGKLTINAMELYGKVEFTPIIVVKKQVKEFTSVDLNEEFDDLKFDLSVGDIIAMDDTHVKYFEFNNQSFDSLVKIRVSKDLDKFEYTVEPTMNFIYITMGSEIHKLYKELQHSKYKSVLGMSLFKDVVFLAIQDLIENEEAETQQWARSFKNKIAEFGFEVPEEADFNQVNLLAQKFVREIGVEKLFKDLKLGG